MKVVNSEEQKWWMIMQSFDHFFLFLSYLVFLYLQNRNKPMDGLLNFPFFILLLSADLYFWSKQTLFPSYPDLINFERQSVFLKLTSRADSAVLAIWMTQRRLLSCWDFKQFRRSTYKLHFWMSWAKLQNSYFGYTWIVFITQ